MEAISVLEIAPLPEMTRLEEAPSYVVGIVSVHGRVVPIVDLHLRFGYAPRSYRLEDGIVFLERHGKTVGVVVNEVHAVHEFDPAEVAPMSSYGFERDGALAPDPQFIYGIASWDDKMVMLLEIESVLTLSQSVAGQKGSGLVRESDSPEFPAPGNPETRAILRERSIQLAREVDRHDIAQNTPQAVVRIGAEFFGIALDVIREFAALRTVAPIPCCPHHVIGQMNLRGDLITILDIRQSLGLPTSQPSDNRRVVVLKDTNLASGVIVDELLGLAYPNSHDLISPTRSSKSPAHDYRLGAMIDGPRTLSLIDLPTLLGQESLIVNEKPS